MGVRRPLVRVNGRIAALPAGDTIDKASVGLGNADNTADANKPVSAAQQAALDLKVAKSNILGTVSQASGLPTGAIVEWGSNSNGIYVRYADGTQICHKRVGVDSSTLTVGTALYGSNAYGGGSYPAAFAAIPTVNAQAQYYTNGSVGFWASCYNQPTQTSWGDWRSVSATSLANGGAINLIAIGRWF